MTHPDLNTDQHPLLDLESLFHIAPIGIGIIKDRVIFSVNDRVCDELGYSRDKLIGQNTRLLYFTDMEYQRVGKILYGMLREKGFGDVETKFKHQNGQAVYIWLRVAWLDPEDHDKGQIFTALNFTQQIKAKQALRENDERFLQAGRFAKFGVWEVDLDSGWVIADETYRQLMGYSNLDKFETPDAWLRSIVSDEDRRVAQILLKKLIRNDIYTLNLEHEAQKKDGTVIQAELMAQVIEKDGKQHLLGFSRDITEYHQMREALKAQQEQYRFLIESTSAILFSADPVSWQFDFISKEAESLLGYPVERWIEEPDFWINHLHPDDRERVCAYCEKCIREKKSHHIDYRFVVADGSVIWLHDLTSVVLEDDQVTKVVGAFIDITPQKHNEAQLRALSNVVEQSQDAIILTDEQFKITYLNPAFTKLYGYTLEEIAGQIPNFLNAEENSASYQDNLYKKISRGENVFDVTLNQRKDGSTFICQFWVSAVRDEDGKVIAYMGSQRDITSMVKQEQTLKESEARYRMLYQEIPQGVILFNPDGSVITANPAAEQILGMKSRFMNDLYGSRLDHPIIREDGSSVPPEAHPAMVALRYGKPVRNQILGTYNPEKNDYVWINLDAVPLFSQTSNDPDRVFTSFSNITEARKLQQALIKSQRMEAVGQLTGGIAHDFNNILGSILGFTELARRNFADGNEKLDHYLQQIETAGGRARDLIRELLIFSRGDSIKAATSQPLIPQIRSIITLLRPMLPAGIEIRTEFEEPSPEVIIDPLHLQQLLMNLSINARDAMQGAGHLIIAVKTVQIEDKICDLCHHHVFGRWVQISVRDSGSGITADINADMFQPFISSKDVGEGSGMGLAVVKGIIEAYNGHILVSTSSEGTCFKLLLPPSTPESSSADIAV